MKISFKNIFSLKEKKNLPEAAIFYFVLLLVFTLVMIASTSIYLGEIPTQPVKISEESRIHLRMVYSLLLAVLSYVIAVKRVLARPFLAAALPTYILGYVCLAMFVPLAFIFPVYFSYIDRLKYNSKVLKTK